MHPDKKKNPEKPKKLQKTTSPGFDMYSLVLLVYALVPVLTPNLGALDSTVSKFLVLAVINFLVFLFLVFKKNSSGISEDHKIFFLNPIGFTFSVLLIITLLSFTQAINIKESVILFFQLFSVLYCVLILMMILKRDMKYLEQLSVVLSLLLIADCLTVFYNIGLFVNNKIAGIDQITSVYSNKNILSSAIFVKIPFLLWLQIYGRIKRSFLYSIVLCMAFLAIFLLSSRAFIIGSGILFLFFILYNGFLFFREKKRIFLKNLIITPIILAVAILFTFLVQFLFYPDEKNMYTVNISDRLRTIEASEGSIHHRLETWKIAGKLIRENPLLGVGAGNWKIAEIEYEGPVRENFKDYMTHTHNDLLEVTAETGITGGFFYLLLFLFPVIFFLISLKKPATPDIQPFLFLSAFGMLCYSVDAMFNFPLGRVEIQILFAIFLAATAWYNPFYVPVKHTSGKWGRLIIFLTGIMTIPALFILYQSFLSARIQKIAQEELLMEKFQHNSAFMLSQFPAIPDITVIGEPISVIKSRYLIADGRFDEAINLLKHDKSSPFDGRQELLLVAAYERTGNKDSVLHYIRKFVEKKPLYYEVVAKNCYLEMEKGRDTVAITIMQRYLSKNKTNADAWSYYSYLFQQAGNIAMSKEVVDSALTLFPGHSLLMARKAYLENEVMKNK